MEAVCSGPVGPDAGCLLVRETCLCSVTGLAATDMLYWRTL